MQLPPFHHQRERKSAGVSCQREFRCAAGSDPYRELRLA
jgi:hypothetical protein